MTVLERPAPQPAAQPKQKSFFQRVLMPLLLVLCSLAVMLYPVVSSTWNNYKQQQAAATYQQLTQNEDPDRLAEALDRAHEYNATKADGPILDPWLARVSEDNVDYQEYLKQLNNYPEMAQVIIPKINLQLPVYHGTTPDVLQRGLGHMFGTSLPVGGEGTHAVITGHTGLTNATLFDNLDKMAIGDAVYISTYGQQMKYEVDKIDVVLPNETDYLKAAPGQDRITLVTCTPYGINSHRLLVHAHRVPMDPSDEGVFTDHGFHMQLWMWLLILAAVIILALMAWWMFAMAKKNRKSEEEEEE